MEGHAAGEDPEGGSAPAPERVEAGERAAALAQHLPGLIQHIAIEALAMHAERQHGRLHLVVAHERDGVVQVVEDQRLQQRKRARARVSRDVRAQAECCPSGRTMPA